VPSVVTLRIADLRPSTPGTRLLRLALDGIRFDFLAGQAVLLGLHGQDERRPYSIASGPDEARRTGWLDFLVKVDASGEPGPHLTGWRTGAAVDIVGPLGGFSVSGRADGGTVLFVAGGTGIAPLRSILRHLIDAGSTARLRLVESARSPTEFAFADEFGQMAAGGLIEWYPTVTQDDEDAWTGPRGRIDESLLASLVEGSSTMCFVCGPPEMVVTVRDLLGRLGIPDERIHREGW
jgi:NAD(P)H-flavin reductase